MEPNIKNYTSIVPADDSVQAIEKKLVLHGATAIMKQYDGLGNIQSISFLHKYGNEFLAYELPANVDAVYKLFVKQNKHLRSFNEKNLMAQAKRTAWKNVHDWVAIQMTMILLQQVDFTQVFLPYMLHNGKSVYTHFKETGLKALAS